MASAFVDTNIVLRHILQDHEDHSPRASALMERIESGEIVVRISDTVVFESVFSLEKTFKVARDDIAEALLPIIGLPAVELPGKASYREVFELWLRYRGLSFADCFHAVCANQFTDGVVYSFDHGFDRVPGNVRKEPDTDGN
ncbi:MAG: PIN domain-containing protein [Thermomicrobiales bacterium]|nr:PIN domain-containing protein [Thermomicrobiales bacterium]